MNKTLFKRRLTSKTFLAGKEWKNLIEKNVIEEKREGVIKGKDYKWRSALYVTPLVFFEGWESERNPPETIYTKRIQNGMEKTFLQFKSHIKHNNAVHEYK